MSRLSSLLVRDRVVDVGTLERAFRRKDLEGGRLGTILLELGAVDEETFHYYLGQAVGLPVPTDEMLRSIDDATLGLIDVRDALAYGAVPAGLQGETLQVLVRDPIDGETLSGLEERIGRQLQQYVLPDFRFEHALAELYGVRPSPRASALIHRFPATIGSSGMTGSHEAVSDDGSAPTIETAPVLARLGKSWTADQLYRFLSHSDSRDDIVQALLGFAQNYFPRCFVLAVTQGKLRGFASKTEGVTVEALRNVTLADSRLLRRALSKGNETLFEGLAPDLGMLGLYDQLDLERPLEVACFVLRIGSRPAMFLVGDNAQKPVPRSALPAVESAVIQAAAALIRLVRAQKRAQKLTGRHTAPARAVRDATLDSSPSERALATFDGGWDMPIDGKEPVFTTAERPTVTEAGDSDETAAAERMTDTDPERPRAIKTSSDAYEAVAEQDARGEGLDDEDGLDDLMFGEIERLVMEEHGDVDEDLDDTQRTLLGIGGARRDQGDTLPGVEPIPQREDEPAASELERDLVPPKSRDFSGPDEMVDALASDDQARALKARAEVLLADAAVLDELAKRFPGPIEVRAEVLGPEQSIDEVGPFFPVIRELGQRFLPQLHDLTRDDDAERRLCATLCLEMVRHSDNVGVIGERLFDDQPAVRRMAATVLRTYRDDPAMTGLVDGVREALASDDKARRLTACVAVHKLGDVEAVPALLERLDDPAPRVAEAASVALQGLTFQAYGDAKKWRKWYKKHGRGSRADWLVAGASSRQRQVRDLVDEALQRAPGLPFEYDPGAGRRQLKKMASQLSQHLETSGAPWL